jgi:ABC-2 type transport system ATP-binding protein
MSNAVIISGLTKTFGPKVAVRDLHLVVPTGSLCGFIGPNGAGKTTTIRMIMSIIFPDSGELSVLGQPSADRSKDRIGYLPEERGVYRKMKVGAFLTYMARLKGVDGGAPLKRKVTDWLSRMGLAENAKKRCEELSKGMQQKVQFIAAVIHEPDLLILDEVFSGLDPVNRKLMRGLIDEQHSAGRTIIFSTHAMYEAEQLCDRVFMIHRGVKVLDATLGEIRDQFDPRTIIVEPAANGNGSTAELRLEAVPGISRIQPTRDGFELHLDEGADPRSVMSAIVRETPVRRVELKRVALEDVFISLVEDSGASHEEAENLRAAVGALGGAGAEEAES